MGNGRVHFEVYVRKTPGSTWTLEMATENRAAAISCAEDLWREGRVVASKVTKETLDEETRGFMTVTVFKAGDQTIVHKKAVVRESVEPVCVTPQDLYTIHARERIGRLLEGWLERNHATPFELLHRPDLVEQLESSGTDLQHAIQKIAIPEAQARGVSVHEIIRAFHSLIERSIERLLSDRKAGKLPDVDKEGFCAAAERVAHEPERGYLLGAGVAASISPARGWTEKVMRLLDLADAAPTKGPARVLALATIAQPLAEILGSKPGLEDILGKGLDLGGNLAAMTRLAAADSVDALIRIEASVAKVMPPLSPAATRLAKWLADDAFLDVRSAIGQRILRELNGPRRLRPGDAVSEIDVLRALAMSLTAAAGKLLPLEDVQSAFSARSKMLTTGEFVEAYLGAGKSAREEAEALIWLTENVIGPANKRQAGRWLKAVISSLKFEKEFRNAPDGVAGRLASLASLQRAAGRCGLVAEDCEPIQMKLGDIGGLVEADARLTLQLAKASASAVHRLTLLLKLACGETAPLGPAADRARAEALKLVRHDDLRIELSQAPEQVEQMRGLIQQAGLAA
ncbi:hypothetical protein [Phenylobacterium soli]|uniref:Uncharacterized protein n=1 Tax=Phenylobacterium soli TaxID=2170551 RepID=A0A328AFJ7_9CAUL|nr:hypothetical protein [Phenylobacterium soli]RAK53643.1 hypothetical protein DJ017_03425 [Phenylobacterium soli]